MQFRTVTGREFTVSTNQLDFAQPARFALTCTDSDGEEKTPYCIHRAPLGSHERFIGFLIEHYAGKFPVWLAPQQVQIIPITDAHHGYAQELAQKMVAAGIRAEAILGPDRMNRKIRQGQQMQVPYLLIVGDQEMADGTVSVRRRDGKREQGVGVDGWITAVSERIQSRLPEL